jgi:hypothetical protein
MMSHLTEMSMESWCTEAQEGASWRPQYRDMNETKKQTDQGRCAQCKSTVTGDVFFGLGERFCSVSTRRVTARMHGRCRNAGKQLDMAIFMVLPVSVA